MDDEEIEQLIAHLRELLFRKGFGWAAVEAEDSLNSMVALRTRALALITAAEIVTVDLAGVELAVDNCLGGAEIRFEPDDTDRPDDEVALSPRDRKAFDAESYSPSGPERREMLSELAAHRQIFSLLRRHLDGVD